MSDIEKNTIAFFWDGPWHGRQEQIRGLPSYVSLDVNERPTFDDIHPVDMIPPSVPTKTVRYKRVAHSSINPKLWRYDYVGEEW